MNDDFDGVHEIIHGHDNWLEIAPAADILKDINDYSASMLILTPELIRDLIDGKAIMLSLRDEVTVCIMYDGGSE